MKRLVPLLLALAAAAGAEPDLASRIEDAMDLETVNALRAEVEEIAKQKPEAPETVALLRKLVYAYWLNSEGHEDEELVLRIEAIPGVELSAFEGQILGRKYLRERRYEDARKRIAHALAQPGLDDEDAEMLRAELRESMGDALEGLGRWEEALGYQESWRPASFCGNCNAAESVRRLNAVARCQYRVGLVREALDALWEQCSEPSEFLGCGDTEAFAQYAEFSVREGRIEKVRERYATLPEELQKEYACMLEVAEAYAVNDAARIVRTVCNNTEDLCDYGVLECCGRMLDDCVPASGQAMAEALGTGACTAVELAGHTHLKELLPQLKAQLEDKPAAETEEWLRWTIVRLEAVP